MEYTLASPPFTLQFMTMKKEELQGYYDWYMEQIPKRIVILEAAVQSTSGFEDWVATKNPESLKQLGQWYSTVAKRKKDGDLTLQTYSIALDIGMYMSQVMLAFIPGTSWHLELNDLKDFAHYGRPSIAGFTNGYFIPSRFMVVLGQGLAKGIKNGNRLYELFTIWKEYAEEQ